MVALDRQVYGFGPFSLDRGERVLLRDGQLVPLRPKDFDMLLVLVENDGRIVDKDELMKRVWPDTFVEEANLSHHVFTLRKALGDDKNGTTYIETIPRRGYRFLGPVTPRLTESADASLLPADARAERPARSGRRSKAFVLTAVAVVALASGFIGWMLKPAPSRAVTRSAITLSPSDVFTDAAMTVLALSPDGTRLVYAANQRLYLRSLDRLDAEPIPGIQRPGLASARVPFFSPDGQWIGFWEQRQLKKVSIHGGLPVPLCELGSPPYGATWAADKTILVGHGSRGIWQVDAESRACKQIVRAEDGHRVHLPQLLPDGRSVLFTLAQSPNWDEAQIVIQSLDSGTRRTIVRGTDARYVPTGHLVYALQNTMVGVQFDPASFSVGTPVVLVEGVQRREGTLGSAAQFAVSPTGTLAYVESKKVPPATRTLVWIDRQGREEPLPTEPRVYVSPRISPDGSRLALDILEDHRTIRVWDFSRRTLTRVTTPAREPVWADGQRLIFLSLRTGVPNLFSQSADGSGTAERLTEGSRIRGADTVTPDGKGIVVRESDGEGYFDLALLDMRHGGGPKLASSEPLVQSPFAEMNAEISPDGQWLAYQSNNSGSVEVYLRPFPNVKDRLWAVSSGGGTEPLWSRDSRELFYRSATGAVMRVSITAQSLTPLGTPTQLFEASSYALGGRGEFAGLLRRTYDVSPDGRRFLMIKNGDAPATTASPERIVLVQNWFEELKAKLPRK